MCGQHGSGRGARCRRQRNRSAGGAPGLIPVTFRSSLRYDATLARSGSFLRWARSSSSISHVIHCVWLLGPAARGPRTRFDPIWLRRLRDSGNNVGITVKNPWVHTQIWTRGEAYEVKENSFNLGCTLANRVGDRSQHRGRCPSGPTLQPRRVLIYFAAP